MGVCSIDSYWLNRERISESWERSWEGKTNSGSIKYGNEYKSGIISG